MSDSKFAGGNALMQAEAPKVKKILSFGEVDTTHAIPPQPSPTIPNHPQPNTNIAPVRDFNKRANTLDRDALPAGLFPGSSKKIYDALYLRTLGAHSPSKSLQATKRDLMNWSGIRNIKTIETHVRYLIGAGLIQRSGENGAREGFTYEVRLPIPNHPQPSPTIPNHPQFSENPTLPNQKTVVGGDQKTVVVGEGQTIDNKGLSRPPKTSFKTNTKDDDEAMSQLLQILQAAEKEVTGKISPDGKWQSVAEELATELKRAAGRTEVVDVPAFFAEHLKRKFTRTVATTRGVAKFPPALASVAETTQPQSSPPTPADPETEAEYERARAELERAESKTEKLDEPPKRQGK